MADINLDLNDIALELGLQRLQVMTLEKRLGLEAPTPETDAPAPIDIEAHRAPPEESPPAA